MNLTPLSPAQIEELEQRANKENDGRGISVIRSMLLWIRAGDWKGVHSLFREERDKIFQYTEFHEWLTKQLKEPDYEDSKTSRESIIER